MAVPCKLALALSAVLGASGCYLAPAEMFGHARDPSAQVRERDDFLYPPLSAGTGTITLAPRAGAASPCIGVKLAGFCLSAKSASQEVAPSPDPSAAPAAPPLSWNGGM